VFASLCEDDEVAQLKARAIDQESLDNRICGRQDGFTICSNSAAWLYGVPLSPALQDISRDLVINATMDDTMVANLALLIDRQSCRAVGRATACPG